MLLTKPFDDLCALFNLSFNELSAFPSFLVLVDALSETVEILLPLDARFPRP